MMRAKLAAGGTLGVHETTLPPSGTPAETIPHHPLSAMWLIREERSS
jgi:hypothetical protein